MDVRASRMHRSKVETLRADDLRHLAECAGSALLWVSERPYVIGVDDLPRDVSAGVYVAEDRAGQVLYVGRVRRAPGSPAIESRIKEHLRQHNYKASEWDRVHVVALEPGTTIAAVNRIESILSSEICPAYGIHTNDWRD